MADQKTNGTLLDRAATLALWTLATLIAVATAGCFAQSYRQLFDWATAHHIPLWFAPGWPLMLDAFTVIGELVLFVSIIRRWPWYTQALGALLAVAGLVASVAAQWMFIPGASLWDRGTAVVAPLGATLGLAAGLLMLKCAVNGTRTETLEDTRDRLVAKYLAARESDPHPKVLDELAPRRSKQTRRAAITADSPEADTARAAIAAALANGETPSAYSVGMTLGGDQRTGRRGNERLARELINEAKAGAQ